MQALVEWLTNKFGWLKKLVGLLTEEFPGRPYVVAGLGILAASVVGAKLAGGWEGAIAGTVAGVILVVVIRIALKPSRSDKLLSQVFNWYCLSLFMIMGAVLLWPVSVRLIRSLDAHTEPPNAAETTALATTIVADPIPIGPDGYPAVDTILDLPDAETVKKSPEVPPQQVSFGIRNTTRIPLKLLMLNCYYHHFRPKDDIMAPKEAWQVKELPATNQTIFCSGFEETSKGWFAFYVRRMDDGTHYYLKTKNIFYSDRPTLTIKLTDDKQKPFDADFSSSGNTNGSN
jgi:hypothetical protein